MQWTLELPKKEGWYWVRGPVSWTRGTGAPCTNERVTQIELFNERGECWDGREERWALPEAVRDEWFFGPLEAPPFGPIQPPRLGKLSADEPVNWDYHET